MNISEKLATANEKVPSVYNAGKSCKELSDFRYYCYNNYRLDTLNYLDTRSGTKFDYMFYNCTNLKEAPEIDLSKAQSVCGMFKGCTSLTKALNMGNGICKNFSSMFADCSNLKECLTVDTYMGTYFGTMFSKCTSLKSVKLNTIEWNNTNSFVNTFYNCSALENVTITGELYGPVSFAWSPLLTLDSLHSIIRSLSVLYSEGSVLTLHSDSWTKLDNDTPPDNYSSWKEYITDYKNWTYA